jgi:hypothetical protein
LEYAVPNDEYGWIGDQAGGWRAVLALYAGLAAAGMRLLIRPSPTNRQD